MHNSSRGSRDDQTRGSARGADRPSLRAQREQNRVTSRDTPPPKKKVSVTTDTKTPPKKVSEQTITEQLQDQLSKKLLNKQGIQKVKDPGDTLLDKDGGEKAAKPPSKFKQMQNTYKNKKVAFRGDWQNEGIEKALNNQFTGVGTALSKGLSMILTPAGSKAVLKFLDTIGVHYFGGLIAALVAFLIVLAGSAILLFCTAAMFLLLLFGAVAIVLFVPDEKVDLSGVDLSGIDGANVTATATDGETGAATSQKVAGGMATPAEVRGKLIAMYADTTPHEGRWHDPRPGRLHLGVDYDLSTDDGNTPVYPAAEGVVQKVYMWKGGRCGASGNETYGWFVDIAHKQIPAGDGRFFVTRYAHLKSKPPVNVGDAVSLNTPIGIIGNTGCSHGPHIHFELIPSKDGSASPKNGVNPDQYLTCSADGRTVLDFRERKAGRYYQTTCLEYSKQIRGL